MGDEEVRRILAGDAVIAEKDWSVCAHTDDATTINGNVTYTVGLTEKGRPELAIVGLPHTLATVLLNECARAHLHTPFRLDDTVHTAAGVALTVQAAPALSTPVAAALYDGRERFLLLIWPRGQSTDDVEIPHAVHLAVTTRRVTP